MVASEEMISETRMTVVPRSAVALPLRMPPPDGFDPANAATWPRGPGRYEWVKGELWYMPPCGDSQQLTTVDVAFVLASWQRAHPEFCVGSNEAGMKLGGDVRGADVAVWRRTDIEPLTGGFPRVPPLLAVEIAGQDESIEDLEEKTRWYLHHGVQLVWLLDPRERIAIVISTAGRVQVAAGGHIPPSPLLPDLAPLVDEFFRQVR